MGRLLNDVQIRNDNDDAPQAARVTFGQLVVVMSDVVEGKRDGSECLAASGGNGKREDTAFTGGLFFAGGQHFLPNLQNGIRGIL